MTTTASSGNSRSNNDTAASSINVMPISSIMVQDVKTVSEEQTILDVCRVMHNNNIGSVVVVASKGQNKNPASYSSSSSSSSTTDGKQPSFDEPTGIITERDIVRHIALKLIAIQAPVHDVMSKPIVTVRPETSLTEAIQIMQTRDFRRLIVVNNEGGIIGIITDKDIFRAIARSRALISGLLSEQQPLPSSPTDRGGLLDQLEMEALTELFRPKLG
ncbi:CBS domain-containing protein [Candidatus Nitrososphaera evergladensis SR1]|jgi:CBS domain-containing protein|uniref:CBS domain-containing protein n=1 Tax=Candidatus Nitrososphaera evergladensis SR1 TaxID=1459636 RepID=A0A075MMZ2_9ARCH|nr:CBS domain-containing protein [Candidatus Nitrososphaera evergladensis]AIF82633.1 CBS domain-containing protein [Candidatus Nitrososphaera evergladensis SR1]